MRIATWNVNGLRARLDFILHWLRERRPDVVGLQELKMEDHLFPHDVFEAEGYQALIHGQKAWNGVAILSRKPAELLQKGLPGQDEFGSRLLTARIGDLRFTTLYCPNGKCVEHEDFPKKLAWFEDLALHLDETGDPESPAVVCGDFNICPAGIDSWNEEQKAGTIFHTDEERERYRRLETWGLEDLYRRLHPDERAFSWWDYRAGGFYRNQGLRIDFLLGTAPVVERLESAEIDRDYRKKKDGLTASDHAPVIADLA